MKKFSLRCLNFWVDIFILKRVDYPVYQDALHWNCCRASSLSPSQCQEQLNSKRTVFDFRNRSIIKMISHWRLRLFFWSGIINDPKKPSQSRINSTDFRLKRAACCSYCTGTITKAHTSSECSTTRNELKLLDANLVSWIRNSFERSGSYFWGELYRS